MVIVAAVVLIGIVLAAILIFAMARRRDVDTVVGILGRATSPRGAVHTPLATGTPVVTIERAAARERRGSTIVITRPSPPLGGPPRPADAEALGVTRRQFLNRAILGVVGLSLAALGTAVVGFLWPVLTPGGFGSVITAGDVSDILASITSNEEPFYDANARAYVHQYPAIDLQPAQRSESYADPILAGFALGFGALYQKCPHLGCRVPWCQSSQWFECPCHGSQYNRVGEKKGGPAPRGMDRFPISIADGTLSIDTSTVYEGPPIGTNTTGQEAEGPHCV